MTPLLNSASVGKEVLSHPPGEPGQMSLSSPHHSVILRPPPSSRCFTKHSHLDVCKSQACTYKAQCTQYAPQSRNQSLSPVSCQALIPVEGPSQPTVTAPQHHRSVFLAPPRTVWASSVREPAQRHCVRLFLKKIPIASSSESYSYSVRF